MKAKTWPCADSDSGLAQHGAARAGSKSSYPAGWLRLSAVLIGNPWSLAAPEEEGCSFVCVLPGTRSSLASPPSCDLQKLLSMLV